MTSGQPRTPPRDLIYLIASHAACLCIGTPVTSASQSAASCLLSSTAGSEYADVSSARTHQPTSPEVSTHHSSYLRRTPYGVVAVLGSPQTQAQHKHTHKHTPSTAKPVLHSPSVDNLQHPHLRHGQISNSKTRSHDRHHVHPRALEPGELSLTAPADHHNNETYAVAASPTITMKHAQYAPLPSR